ncbi:simple sugar transport system permease protein [Hydrogenispora ethanolica]|jgi:simple sugar transport system permease protein|uniref:Simple sugar transport system permease protein n=1 Tax=Hydrogenispora ethanolica TaxID=1082276 RepID=A0A4V2QGP5_HYDET|nr:ABC transporter permease [Hydrogenispora ethanolica]TCL76437.1 simple sugar transport system permease protein [Hydrogenispora ethanolica]
MTGDAIKRLFEAQRRRGGTLFDILCPVASVLLAFLAAGLLLLLLKINPLEVYGRMIAACWGDPYTLAEMLVKATPLLLTGLSFAFAFKAGLFNIGADGQFYMGALAAVFVSLKLAFLGPWLVLPLAFAAAVLLGGLYSGLAGYLKARFNANEIIVTIMMNYVAFQLVNFVVNGPLKERAGAYPQTDPIPAGAQLPLLVPGTRLHIGLILALLGAAVFYFLLNQTSIGFQIRAVGLNPRAAGYAGMNTRRVVVSAMAVSGLFAGAAGFMEINGVQHILIQGFAPDVGTVGTVIALLANTNPAGIVIGSIFFGFLQVGANMIAQTSQVPRNAIDMIQGFVVLFVLISYYIQYRVSARRKLKQLTKGVTP